MIEAPSRPENSATTATPSVKRVLAAGLVAVVPQGLLWILVDQLSTPGDQFTGPPAWLSVIGTYFASAYISTRLAGVRTLWFGVIAAVPPIIYAVATFSDASDTRSIPLTPLITLAGAALARRTIGGAAALPRQSLSLLVALGALVTVGSAAATHVDPGEAALAATHGGEVLAITDVRPLDQTVVLVSTPGDNLLVTVRRGPLNNWVRAGTKSRRWPDMLSIPENCTHYERPHQTEADSIRVCVIDGPRDLLTGIAPARAATVELVRADGGIQRKIRLRTGRERGFVAYADDWDKLNVFRVVYRDSDGRLLDAPASPTGFRYLDHLFAEESLGCVTGDAPICKEEFDREASMMVSISVLLPQEFKQICGVEPPDGTFILLGSVFDYGPGAQPPFPQNLFRDRRIIGTKNIQRLAKASGGARDGWIGLPQTREPCFPGPENIS